VHAVLTNIASMTPGATNGFPKDHDLDRRRRRLSLSDATNRWERRYPRATENFRRPDVGARRDSTCARDGNLVVRARADSTGGDPSVGDGSREWRRRDPYPRARSLETIGSSPAYRPSDDAVTA
jgi:hypothetical protein